MIPTIDAHGIRNAVAATRILQYRPARLSREVLSELMTIDDNGLLRLGKE
jgi:hypothetical protein